MNRVTIMPEDKFCIVDGVGYDGVDMTTVSLDIHAVQWFTDSGWIEFKSTPEGKPENQPIESLDAFSAVLASWSQIDYDHKHPAPPPPPSPEQNKATASGKLYETDWAVLPDVTNLVNKDEFIAYREKIRDYVFNPVGGEIDWPVEPKAVWGA